MIRSPFPSFSRGVWLGAICMLAAIACGRDPLMERPVGARSGSGGSTTTGQGSREDAGQGGSTLIDGGSGGRGVGGNPVGAGGLMVPPDMRGPMPPDTADGGGIGGAVAIRVDMGPALVPHTLVIRPANAAIPFNNFMPFQFRAYTLAGTDMYREVTAECMWFVETGGGTNGLGEFSLMAGKTGLFTPQKPGPVQIRAILPQPRLVAVTTATIQIANISGLTASPVPIVVAVGQSQPIKITVLFNDGSSRASPDVGFWSVMPPTVASVSNSPGSVGTVTGLMPGSAVLTGSYAAVSVQIPITVLPGMAVMPILNITPQMQARAVGEFLVFDASIGTQNVGGVATWQSSDPTVIQSVGAGRFRCLNVGTVTIIAAYQNSMAKATAACTAPMLAKPVEKLALLPDNASIPPNRMLTLRLDAIHPDMSTTRIQNGAVWTSSDPMIVSVQSGTVYANKIGTATITATFDGKTATAKITVTPP